MTKDDIYVPLKAGSKLKLIKSTTSFPRGASVEIEGFLDNDPNKIVVKGILPGGFIRPAHFERTMTAVRHMTLLEMLEAGISPTLFPNYGNLTEKLLNGMTLSSTLMGSIASLYDKEYLSYQTNGGHINIDTSFLTKAKDPIPKPDEYEMAIDPNSLPVFHKATTKGTNQEKWDKIQALVKDKLYNKKWKGSNVVKTIYDMHYISALNMNGKFVYDVDVISYGSTMTMSSLRITRNKQIIYSGTTGALYNGGLAINLSVS